MLLPLDALWFVVLILILVVFCIAYLISPMVFGLLILIVIFLGLVLTPLSMFSERRLRKKYATYEGMLLKYLQSHGIGGELSTVAQSLGLTQEEALKLLLSLEGQGLIPAGSAKAMQRKP